MVLCARRQLIVRWALLFDGGEVSGLTATHPDMLQVHSNKHTPPSTCLHGRHTGWDWVALSLIQERLVCITFFTQFCVHNTVWECGWVSWFGWVGDAGGGDGGCVWGVSYSLAVQTVGTEEPSTPWWLTLTNAPIHTYLHTWSHTHGHKHTHTNTNRRMRTHTHTHPQTRACMNARTQLRTCHTDSQSQVPQHTGNHQQKTFPSNPWEYRVIWVYRSLFCSFRLIWPLGYIAERVTNRPSSHEGDAAAEWSDGVWTLRQYTPHKTVVDIHRSVGSLFTHTLHTPHTISSLMATQAARIQVCLFWSIQFHFQSDWFTTEHFKQTEKCYMQHKTHTHTHGIHRSFSIIVSLLPPPPL